MSVTSAWNLQSTKGDVYIYNTDHQNLYWTNQRLYEDVVKQNLTKFF
jgi:hypothetical protein